MGASWKVRGLVSRSLAVATALAAVSLAAGRAGAADGVPDGVDRDSAPFSQSVSIGCAKEGGMLADFCVGPDSQVLALVHSGNGKIWGAPAANTQSANSKPGCELRVFDAEGKLLHTWPVSFMAQAINVGPDGLIYIAGDGKLAALDREGKVIRETSAPQVRSIEDRMDEFRELAKEQLAQEREMYADQLKLLKEQLKQLEADAKANPQGVRRTTSAPRPRSQQTGLAGALLRLLVGKSEDETAVETATTAAVQDEPRDVKAEPRDAEEENDDASEDQIAADDDDSDADDSDADDSDAEDSDADDSGAEESELEVVEDEVEIVFDSAQQVDIVRQQIAAYEQVLKDYETRTVDDVVQQMTARARTVNAIAVGDKDVFVACAARKGYGYAVWRTDLLFESPEQVVEGLVGCCGQMDIQCCNGEIWVCENARHRVVRYDRDGRELSQFGERGRDGEGAAFSGCCNPMNLCFGKNGDLYVAESNGVVKRFSQEGKYLGLLGVAGVQPGCKNSAVGVAADEGKLFYIDIQNSNVIVLSKNDEPKAPAAGDPSPKPGKRRASTDRPAARR